MKFVLALVALFLSVSAFSQTRVVSIDPFDLNYTGGLLFKSDSGHSPSRDETTFRLNLNYAQNWDQYVGMMWKVRAYYNRQDVNYGDNDLLQSAWGAAGGLLYNFDSEHIKDSLFVGALIGLERASVKVGNGNDKSGFNIFTDLEAGKRFDLGQYSVANISYAPTIAVTLKRYGGAIRDDYYKTGSEVKFNFLKFDILF